MSQQTRNQQPTAGQQPHAAQSPVDGASPAGDRPGPPRRVMIILGVIAALLVAGTIVAVVIDRLGSGSAAGPGFDGGDGAPAWTVQEPLGGRTVARLEVLDGATEIRVLAADLGDQLLRARTPPQGAVAPQVTVRDDSVQVGLAETGNGGTGVLDIELHRDVRWSVRILGGATEQRIDLTGTRISEVELAGGVSTLDIVLPEPDGTVGIRMSGGAGTWRVEAPAQVPVRVRAGSGAGSISVDGERRDGVAAGETVSTPSWEETTDRYDIDAAAGFSDLTVTRVD
ncbi:hypothetical protein ACN27F_00715 [Solwaraspora sp. WMMB335]|uniref:hypothetical protein n=1 Tax=Solwaraspora sp. WMMB335 TaxID=3404118 RepID=UPI003B92B8FB